MGWLANNLRGDRSHGSLDHPSEDRWGTLLVPPELVEEHPRSRDRALLLVRYTVVAGLFTLLLAPYLLFYLKLPYTLPTNLLYLLSLGVTLVILRKTRSLGLAANWTLSCTFAVLMFQSVVLGGTASLSNLGMFGTKQFDAVINPPQGMILAVGAGEQRPYVVDGELSVATVMSVTGSFDHRAIDGVDGAKLLDQFRSLIENPMGLVV